MTNTIKTTLNPEGPAPPVPTIDPSFLKLDGRTYRDLSRPAAAQRAAYFRAKAAQFRASPPAEQAAMAGIGNHFANFTNYGTSADWTPDGGAQGAGAEGWMLHSHGNTSSRVVFNYPINDGSSPHTVVRVWMRGAPNNGKNSYASLIEQLCADNPNHNPPYFCDEIDIVEYYGQTSHTRSEFTVHKNGQQHPPSTFVWSTPLPPTSPQAPGHAQTSYGIYLEPGHYLNAQLYAPNGLTVQEWEQHSSDPGAYIPSRAMKLYVGIWDIGLAPGSLNVDNPPGSYTGDAWMALSEAQVYTAF
jgi:hypothetical protein